MRLSVVFATRANEFALPHVRRIFGCLASQTFQDFEVIVVCDREFEKEEDFRRFLGKITEDLLGWGGRATFYTNLNSDFVPNVPGRSNGSYVRNFGMKQAKGELIQLFDDDNGFDEEYLEKAVKYYDEQTPQLRAGQEKQMWSEVVVCSSLYYRDTGELQNQGFKRFCYWQSRPVVNFLVKGKESSLFSWCSTPPAPLQKGGCANIQMFSGNGLLGNAEVFRSVGYDEEMAWIAEDLDFTLSLHERGVKLFTYADLVVRHYERDKARLEHSWIGSASQAQQKARNWFLFVDKHGKFWDRVQFYLVGLPGCLVWLSVKAILYGGKERWRIIGGLFRGCREGIKILDSRKKDKDSRVTG